MNSAFSIFLLAGKVALSFLILAVVLYYWLLRTKDDPARLVVKWVVTAGLLTAMILSGSAAGDDPYARLFALFFGLLCGLAFAVMWAPNFAGWVGGMFTSLYDGGDEQVEPRPFYSIAEAKRKHGKYEEAIAEVEKQLAKFPEDFQGWMLLASIYGEDLKDNHSAQRTIDRVLEQQNHTPKNLTYALNQSADWHLRLAHDPVSARHALEQIIEFFPETEYAQSARQRLAHLTSDDHWRQKSEPRKITVTRHEENLGLLESTSHLRPAEIDPGRLAANYIEHLQQHPHDDETREKLALIYAGHFKQLNLALEQLELLAQTPHQQQKDVVRWLNLMADLQIKHASDLPGARAALQRLIDLFPESAAAQAAQNRISYLHLELRGQQKSQPIKLGSYRQNIGLE
jgi:outer membrane protein assembly factor BamD (BamD/ComL family)